ncbi:ASCH domain-containing protein [Chitinophaga sp. 22321]|uniref:ASCH domain-containing protein n=1 Tax=Chitinophaga hostae TaxID=2831022 RepID=A0ABS5IU87_9BACT|nr:ASCH domain-containing protein [Chitinophaga hostae]MBS0026475.1 ASCH domain-containing protein [Chitinophaga hostae]
MLFKQIHLDGIKTGEISLAFRKWKKLSVKANSQVKTAIGVVQIGRVEMVKSGDITRKDAAAAGYAQPEELMKLLATISEGDIYKIAVRYHAEDPRIALREQVVLSDEAFELLSTQLARLDQYSKEGKWTITVLTTIRDYPKLRAADIAVKTGREKQWLKLNIRKLKNLGLTISHDTGYTLSPLGALFLNRRQV